MFSLYCAVFAELYLATVGEKITPCGVFGIFLLMVWGVLYRSFGKSDILGDFLTSISKKYFVSVRLFSFLDLEVNDIMFSVFWL